MLTEKENTRISKFLSLVLRHEPARIGIELDQNGWTDVNILIDKMNSAGIALTLELLHQIVSTNSKSRFSFNENRTSIRASQGHSVEINLGYLPQQPPAILFHGTAEHSLPSILQTGLEKRERHHVHLSSNVETATTVGMRYGRPVVLKIDAASMYTEGMDFYLTDNEVWLTDHVPARFISKHQ